MRTETSMEGISWNVAFLRNQSRRLPITPQIFDNPFQGSEQLMLEFLSGARTHTPLRPVSVWLWGVCVSDSGAPKSRENPKWRPHTWSNCKRNEGMWLTVSGLLEVNVGVAQGSSGHHIPAHANRHNRARRWEFLKQHSLSDVLVKVSNIERCHFLGLFKCFQCVCKRKNPTRKNLPQRPIFFPAHSPISWEIRKCVTLLIDDGEITQLRGEKMSDSLRLLFFCFFLPSYKTVLKLTQNFMIFRVFSIFLGFFMYFLYFF